MERSYECQLKKSHNLKLYSEDFLKTSSLGGVFSDSVRDCSEEEKERPEYRGLKKRSGRPDIKRLPDISAQEFSGFLCLGKA